MVAIVPCGFNDGCPWGAQNDPREKSRGPALSPLGYVRSAGSEKYLSHQLDREHEGKSGQPQIKRRRQRNHRHLVATKREVLFGASRRWRNRPLVWRTARLF